MTPQAGDFYGGWITADIVGPFKRKLPPVGVLPSVESIDIYEIEAFYIKKQVVMYGWRSQKNLVKWVSGLISAEIPAT